MFKGIFVHSSKETQKWIIQKKGNTKGNELWKREKWYETCK